MSILIALTAGLWRMVDGRDFRPSSWNALLYVGLGWLCYDLFGATLIALAVYALTLVNILSGYKAFTWGWVDFLCTRVNDWLYYRDDDVYIIFVENNKYWYGQGGFHTWHTAYRFLIPSIAICSLTSWNFYWLGATVVAGSLFPLTRKYWNTETAAWIREFILGAVVIGGLACV